MEAAERLEWEKLPTEELAEELKYSGLNLPPGLIEEIHRRGAEMLPLLGEMLTDEALWQSDFEEAWAPIYALHLLGAIALPDAAPYLIAMLRLNPDSDLVIENTPTILGHLGPSIIPELTDFIGDEKADGLMRGVACDGLAAIAILYPEKRDEILAFLRRFVSESGQHNPEAVSGAILTLVSLRDHEALPAIAQAFLLGQADESLLSLEDAQEALSQPETISADWHYTGDPLDFFSAENQKRRREKERHG